MKTIRIALAAFLAVFAFAAKATDKTDLWWNPNESGWGMTIAHQGTTLFITMYVYGTNSQPTWYVGTLNFQSTDASGTNIYTGTWYSTTGPYHGGAFNPASVVATPVGSVTYRAISVTSGQVTYNVGGTTVTKNVQRQTLQNNPDVYGTFGGGYVSDTTGASCAFPGHVSSFVTLTISGTPASTTAQIAFATNGAVCSVIGAYTQSGRMGQLSGTLICGNGLSGTGNVFEIEAGTNVISARFTMTYAGCTEVGHFAAAFL
jgi:hypothetical protein